MNGEKWKRFTWLAALPLLAIILVPTTVTAEQQSCAEYNTACVDPVVSVKVQCIAQPAAEVDCFAFVDAHADGSSLTHLPGMVSANRPVFDWIYVVCNPDCGPEQVDHYDYPAQYASWPGGTDSTSRASTPNAIYAPPLVATGDFVCLYVTAVAGLGAEARSGTAMFGIDSGPLGETADGSGENDDSGSACAA